MLLKISIKFSIYTKGGTNFEKLDMARCFISNFNSFLKFLCNWRIFFGRNKEKKRKKKKYLEAML